jgi:Na+-translocating ferredoxin:NAD+ oxidoreductase RnfD subunit
MHGYMGLFTGSGAGALGGALPSALLAGGVYLALNRRIFITIPLACLAAVAVERF